MALAAPIIGTSGSVGAVGVTRASRDVDSLLALVDLLYDRPSWWRDALCREPAYAGVNFYPDLGESIEPAKAVCARCLVRRECLAFALERHERHGVWGGLSPGQRKRGEALWADEEPAVLPPAVPRAQPPPVVRIRCDDGTVRLATDLEVELIVEMRERRLRNAGS